jgi:hypothetical protein
VLNADQIPTLSTPVQTMRDSLLDGRLGYRLALKVRSPVLPVPFIHPDLGPRPRHGPEFSDLSMINPTMEVFQRMRADERPSLESKRVDRIEPRRLTRGVVAEEHADGR